jgi:uncharacterized protein YacL
LGGDRVVTYCHNSIYILIQMNKFQEKTDDELVEDAGMVVVGTPSGLKAQWAQVEMMRRLKNAMERAEKSTTNFNKITLIFSLVVVFLTLVQVWIALIPLFSNIWWAVATFFLIVIALAGIFQKAEKTLFRDKR